MSIKAVFFSVACHGVQLKESEMLSIRNEIEVAVRSIVDRYPCSRSDGTRFASDIEVEIVEFAGTGGDGGK